MGGLETRCPSCGLALPEDPRFPREACPACGSFLEEPPLVRGELPDPLGLDEFLALCGPHAPEPEALDDVTAIVKVTPKRRPEPEPEPEPDDQTVVSRKPGTS